MVQSKINADVTYSELKNIDKKDFKTEATLYELEIKNIEVIIAIGNVKNTFESEGILYFPIYLVKYNNKVIQIGVYEITVDSYPNYLDINYNFDIETLDQPLLYSFVTEEMLENLRLKPSVFISKEEKYDIPEERKDIFILSTGIHIAPLLDEENDKTAKDIRENYTETADDTWVEKFMKNKNYSIIDNEGGGDCFFATIRDAFSSIGQQTTIHKIREKLSKEITLDIFSNYKEQYDMYYNLVHEETTELKRIQTLYTNLKEKVKNTLDHNEKKQLHVEAKNIKSQYDRLTEEKKVSAQILSEYKFMKGVDTLEKFKKKVRTCEFWAETWAISTLERILNIKFIILSSENYKSGDIRNILQCGQLNDTYLQEKGVFTPEFYIMVEYTGTHYKLIGYKNKLLFRFIELPYDIKMLIVDKCMEKNSGPFALIKHFNEFRTSSQKTKETKESQKSKETKENEELRERTFLGLYDDDVTFVFYENSNDKPLPGKGSGEQITNEKLKEFSVLASIDKWRKKLTNLWYQPFTLDNHKWASVENYYQASKYKKNNPSFYLSFSLDSDTELSKNPDMAKGAGGKTGKYKGVLVRPKTVTIDPDFYDKRYKEEMYNAQYSKFTQDEELKKLLLSTKNAKLTHYVRGSPPIIFEDLMLVREKIRKDEL